VSRFSFGICRTPQIGDANQFYRIEKNGIFGHDSLPGEFGFFPLAQASPKSADRWFPVCILRVLEETA
jgi:hypothetical protein